MKIKNAFLITLLVMLSISTLAEAQSSTDNNYVVLTKKVPQLQPILLAAEELKLEDNEKFGAFEIIICGQQIGDITDASKIDKFLDKAEKLGVTIVVCGFSLNKFNVDRKDVPKQMKIVENGILYNLQLQRKGYYSLGL